MTTLSLDRKLYSARAVKQAAAQFARLARFKVVSGKQAVAVTIDKIDPDVGPVLVDEFLNFALAATIEARG